MNMDQYIKKYLSILDKHDKGIAKLDDWKIFEILSAIEMNQILWKDLPPWFGTKHNLPHMKDYGIDLISLDYKSSSQVKKYGANSSIKWTDFAKFWTYAKENIQSNEMFLITTNEAKISKMIDNQFINENKVILKRFDYNELLSKYNDKYKKEEKEEKINIELRYYLLDCYKTICKSKDKNMYFQLPCGTGKSYIIMYTIQQNLGNGKFLIIVPWKDLAYQMFDLCEKMDIDVCLIGDGYTGFDDECDVTICVINSIKHIPADMKFKYVFIDEAHHIESTYSIYGKEIMKLNTDKYLNFSATFKFEKKLHYNMPFDEAVEKGFISDYVLDVQYLTEGDKMKAMVDMIKSNMDWSPMFIYFSNTEKCIKFNKMLVENGINSHYLTGKSSEDIRKKVNQLIKNGELVVLCLCGVYNEGISFDNLNTVIFGDKRHSDLNRIQIIMRACRKHPEKPFFRIVIPTSEDELGEKEIKNLIKSFTVLDKRLEKLKSNNTVLRVNVNRNNETNEEAVLLYNKVYNSYGKLMNIKENDVKDDVKEDVICAPSNKEKVIKCKKTKKNIIECKKCHKQFKRKVYLRNHIKKDICVKYKNMQFECTICDKRYSLKKTLIQHIKNKHDTSKLTKNSESTETKCILCNKTFSSRSNVKRHLVSGKCPKMK